MYETIQLSSCVSVQGELVDVLDNGDVVVRDGRSTYRGRPMGGAERLEQLRTQVMQTLRSATLPAFGAA